MDNSRAMNLIYEYCLSKAYDDTVGISEEEGRTHLILTRLAGYCQESGLSMAVAQRLAMFSLSLGKEPNLVKKVFKGAYAEDEGSYIKIGNFLSRPECKFESERKTFGMVYWVKER